MKGIIFDIKRFAVHDGPGIRTTVFLKGCPLSCKWCHNPEGINPELVVAPKTVQIEDKVFTEDEAIGCEISSKDLLAEILKEKIFMDESAGGVTFSGGEPLYQHLFLIEMLSLCKREGIHTALDTSGFANWKIVQKVLPFTDLFLYDLKMMDDVLHEEYTGVSNKIILRNLSNILAKGKKLRVRIPMIPGVTLTEQNVKKTIRFLKRQEYPVDGVDLLPYHNIANHKYSRLNMKNAFKDIQSLSKDGLNDTKLLFEAAGFDTKIGG